ncbi:hypothetical protein HHL28_04735 [Aerophototrophica crusticola]|uniref:SPOR domain-containing protein n=1 Tax=Aerophototrophica crusticola TaxID=1709002 RepID=A0A858R5A1_9PROT|nr:hypothetical protein HHL28_04735 [Rhodospirillaceae bacterium B3]
MSRLVPMLLLAGLVAWGAAPPVRADLDVGRKAFAAGDLTTAHKAFLASAEAGDPTGQFLVGQMLLQGRGVDKDPAAGLVWLEKAAASGHVGAMSAAGTLYAFGEEVPADYAKALALLVPAAEAGDANAQNNAATLFYFGLGTPKDLTEALRWAILAERQNVVTAIRLRSEIEAEASPAMKAEALRRSNQPLKGPPRPAAVAQVPARPAPQAVASPPPPAAAPPRPEPEPLVVPTPREAGPPPAPVPAAPAPAPTPPPQPAAGAWAVQLAALPSRAEAEKEWQAQRRRLAAVLGDREAGFAQVDLGAKGVYTRILLGGLPDKAAAEDLCRRIKEAGGDCLVRKP